MLHLKVKKISDFTEKLVKQLRAQTKALQVKVTADKGHQQTNELMRVRVLTTCDLFAPNRCCCCLPACSKVFDHTVTNSLRLGHFQEAQRLGDEFLSLEKYVNLNYLV